MARIRKTCHHVTRNGTLRELRRCRECGGKGFCIHNRQRNLCKDCGGSSFCEHNRQRNRCKDCGGSSICKHNRQRNRCKDCGGSSICKHNRLRIQCKDCGGSSLCKHSRQRSQCKDCGGSSYCEHNRVRSQCKDCKGTSICEHRRRRNRCKDCKGTSICEHRRLRNACRECVPIGSSKRNCITCNAALSALRRSAKRTFCAQCDKETPPRIEHIFRNHLIAQLPPILQHPSAADDILFGGAATCESAQRHRPDLLWISHDLKLAVNMEIDEDAHENVTPTCDLARVSRLYDYITTASAGAVTDVVFIRIAIYDGGRDLEKLASEAATMLVAMMSPESHHLYPKGTGAPVIKYVNYGKTTAAAAHVDAATHGVAADGIVVIGGSYS